MCIRDSPHTHLAATEQQGVGHVAASIAKKDDLDPLQSTLVFDDGHQVGQRLTGMKTIGQPVYNRNGRMVRQFHNLIVVKSADHDAVKVAGEGAGSIPDRLPPPHLQILGVQEKGITP